MLKLNKHSFIAAVIVTTISGFAYAHDGAMGVVKERMDMMGEIAKGMKTIGSMLQGKIEFDPADAQAAAMEISGHAAHMPEMFPKGSIEKPSEALPIIWEDWDKFVELANELNTDAKLLADQSANASNVDEIKLQFSKVAKSCGTCHQVFRLKE